MATLQLAKSGSRRLTEFSFKHSKADLPSQRVSNSLTSRVEELPTRQVGELFFDYLREFEAKSRTARKVV
jgi:hypothetical protein